MRFILIAPLLGLVACGDGSVILTPMQVGTAKGNAAIHFNGEGGTFKDCSPQDSDGNLYTSCEGDVAGAAVSIECPYKVSGGCRRKF